MMMSGVISETNHRAVFTDGAGEGQRKTGHQRRQDGRQDDQPENLPAARTEARGGLLELGFEILENRLDSPDDKGKPDEDERHDDARRSERDFDPERLQELAEPSVLRVERGQGNAGDGRG